jgi:heme-degrading monooxygenase HmoA
MVLEIAQLTIKTGQEEAFKAAFAQAALLIRDSAGCNGLDLRRSIEHPNRFLLLIQWDSVKSQEKGAAASPPADDVGALLGPFFDGPPFVEHSESVLTA